MTKIYYSVCKLTESAISGEQFLTGDKEVSVYRVKNNDLDMLATFEIGLEDNTEGAVQEFLEDEGFEDCELVLL